MDAVEDARKPSDESADPASHSDPEARSPSGGVQLAVGVVVVVETPADSSNNSSKKGKRQEQPSAASSVGEILEAVVDAEEAVK